MCKCSSGLPKAPIELQRGNVLLQRGNVLAKNCFQPIMIAVYCIVLFSTIAYADRFDAFDGANQQDAPARFVYSPIAGFSVENRGSIQLSSKHEM